MAISRTVLVLGDLVSFHCPIVFISHHLPPKNAGVWKGKECVASYGGCCLSAVIGPLVFVTAFRAAR